MLDVTTVLPPSGAPPDRPPLLFVHGAWQGAWCWEDNVLPHVAARGYTGHAVSLRGHGASTWTGSSRLRSLGDYVADVASVADELEAAPVLIGHSMGGLVVQRYLAEGGRARAGVLMASVPPSGVIGTVMRVATRSPLRFLEANAAARLWPIVRDLGDARHWLFSETLSRADLERHHARMVDESYRAFLGMLVPRIATSRVTVPMLVMGGSEDRLISPRDVERTARAYGVKARLFADVAHHLPLEPGWRGPADLMLEWIAGLA